MVYELSYFGAGKDLFMTFAIAFEKMVMFFQMNVGKSGGHASGSCDSGD